MPGRSHSVKPSPPSWNFSTPGCPMWLLYQCHQRLSRRLAIASLALAKSPMKNPSCYSRQLPGFVKNNSTDEMPVSCLWWRTDATGSCPHRVVRLSPSTPRPLYYVSHLTTSRPTSSWQSISARQLVCSFTQRRATMQPNLLHLRNPTKPHPNPLTERAITGECALATVAQPYQFAG